MKTNIMEKFGITEEYFDKLVTIVRETYDCAEHQATMFLNGFPLPEGFNPTDYSPGTYEHPKMFGLLDRDTSTWMGSSEAPLTYDNFAFALVRARLIGVQLKWSALRIVVRFFTSTTKKLDDVEVAYSSDEALERLEQGLTL